MLICENCSQLLAWLAVVLQAPELRTCTCSAQGLNTYDSRRRSKAPPTLNAHIGPRSRHEELQASVGEGHEHLRPRGDVLKNKRLAATRRHEVQRAIGERDADGLGDASSAVLWGVGLQFLDGSWGKQISK